MTKKVAFITLIVALLCVVGLSWSSLSRERQAQQTIPSDNSVNSITSDIRQHASSILNVQSSSSSTSFWADNNGYMAIVPNQSALQSYINISSAQNVNDVMNADQQLTEYTSQRLEYAGYKPDQDNSSTSTDNGPFYTLRIAFVSSDGRSRCLIKPPKPLQFQINISTWDFYCVSTQDIQTTIQGDLPFLRALGYAKGAAITHEEQGTVAAVGVFGEEVGGYNAILIKSAGGWKVIFKGQAPPSCSLMQKYGVPQSIYRQCM